MGASPSLRSLPSEVMIQILCQLPCLPDVLALSAACRRTRDIWSSNVARVYDCLAPKSIPCIQHARSFLADQGGLALDSAMTTKGVASMMKNASVIEKAILQFEREIVCRVKSKPRISRLNVELVADDPKIADGIPTPELEECYGVGARGHPPTMTPTERTRFVQNYYTLWGLMSLNPSEWKSSLEVMTSQELYYLHEITKLTQSIGGQEIIPPPIFPDQLPESVHAINSGRSEKRISLEETVWQQIEHTSQRIFGQEAIHPEVYAKHEGFMWFVVIWDHWQPSLKDAVLHTSRSAERPSPEVVKRYLWNDNHNSTQPAG